MPTRGPALGLPPTLTPGAVLAMAPPAPRAMSLLASGLIYATLGAGLSFVPSLQTSHHTPPPTERYLVPERMAPETTSPHAVIQLRPPTPLPGLVAQNAPRRPDGWTPPVAANTVPEGPTTMPNRNATGDSLRASTPADTLRPSLPTQTGSLATPATPTAPVEFDFQQMRILQRVDPVYPPLARLARVQGEVVLLMAVDSRGVPMEVRALSGPHPSLEHEAMRVARLWRFEPATLNGQAVAAQFRLTIRFHLH